MFNKKMVLGSIVFVVTVISGCAPSKTHPTEIMVKETHIKDQGRNYAYCDNCVQTAKRS